MAKTDEQLRAMVEDANVLIGGTATLGALGLLAYQSYAWLRYGAWPDYQGNDLLALLGMNPALVTWVGVRKIAVWLGDLPLALWIAGLGWLACGLIWWMIENHIHERTNR